MEIAKLQSMKIGDGFRATAIRGGEMAQPIDPFLGVDHAHMSAPTFQPYPHAGFSAVSYLFEDSTTGILNSDPRAPSQLPRQEAHGFCNIFQEERTNNLLPLRFPYVGPT